MNYQWFTSPATEFYPLPDPLNLELGGSLAEVRVAYRTWGQLNPEGDNVILVCHALTGSADADDWWEPLFGLDRALDPSRHFIICSNILGSCYGTTGPVTPNPATGRVYGAEFPAITIRDMVQAQAHLVTALGIRRLQLVIGGSLGGMQVLEWALLYPERVAALAVIAASGRHSDWCIGLSEAQRQAIYTDPHWQGGYYTPDQVPAQGLAVARMIAMSTYRSHLSFQTRFGRERQAEGWFAVEHYLRHQGEKLVSRFDANTYVTLTKAMDRHDVACGRGDYEAVLAGIAQPTLIIAIDSDLLYPPSEQQELANWMPNAELAWIKSPHGHDAFLIEMAVLNDLVVAFQHPTHSRPVLSN